MKEIVDTDAVGRLFFLLAVLGPWAGAGIGAAWGAKRGRVKEGAVRGVLIGLLATLNGVLWTIYNGIVERTGLDSVRNVVVNGLLFGGVGITLGILTGLAQKRKAQAVFVPGSTQNDTD